MKRCIVRVALVGALLLIASAQASAAIPYLGGRVMPRVRIVLIPYGPDSFSGSAIALATDLADYLRGAKSPVGKQSLYAQYGISDGQLLQGGFSPFDNNPRVLDDTEVKNVIHAFQQQNSNPYALDKVFVLLPGPGYSLSQGGDCGYRSSEGDGNYYAVVPRNCPTFLQTLSRHVLETATDPNGDGWAGVVGACFPNSTRNFGAGLIALPFDNLANNCAPSGGDPNVWPFNNKMIDVLHVVATKFPEGTLSHTVRHPTYWSPMGNVKAAVGSDPGRFAGVDSAATLGVFNHVVAVRDDGTMFHTIRTESAWTPFVNVRDKTGTSTNFSKVALANVNGDLHVCGMTAGGGVFHAIRYLNGTWTVFGNVLAQPEIGNPPDGVALDIACAGIGADMHIAITTQSGHLYHAIRYSSGPWSGWGDVEGTAAGDIGNVRRVAITNFGGELNLIATNLNDQQYHTIRHTSSWTLFKIPGPPANISVIDHACAGVADLLHVVSIETVTGIIRHRVRDIASWSPVGNASAEIGGFTGPWSIGAASVLGY